MGAELLFPLATILAGLILVGGLILTIRRLSGAVDRERVDQLKAKEKSQEKARVHISKPTTGDWRRLAARWRRRRKRVQDGDPGET